MSIPDSSLVTRRVASYRYVVCGSPDYLTRRGRPGTPADLVQHNCLIYSRSQWGDDWRFAGPEGELSIPVKGNLHANSDNALRLAAVHGQGLAMAPSFLVKDEIKSGRLVPVLTEFLQAEYAINAIYPHRHHLSAKVRSFIDLLAKHFRADPSWADPCRSYVNERHGSNGAEGPALPLTGAEDASDDGGTAQRSAA
jgi:DNA-binding transcriptional LysR family regulator